MASNPRYWTDEEVLNLKKWFSEGLSDEDIANRLERTKISVFDKRHKLGLVNAPYWNDEKIREGIIECVGILMIDRMPTAVELKSIGRNDLHVKISRTKKYSGWAKELGLELKSCNTRIGHKYEDIIEATISQKGYIVERMTTKYPYDLLVNGSLKVDVKSGKAHYPSANKTYTFAINKVNPTCDLYILVAVGEENEIDKIFIIPSHYLKTTSLNVRDNSEFDEYIDRWDLIESYVTLFQNIK